MNTFTVQPQTFEAILNRYAPHLESCRDLIIADLQKTPSTAVLAGYFQGGKRFRALLAFVAASAIGITVRYCRVTPGAGMAARLRLARHSKERLNRSALRPGSTDWTRRAIPTPSAPTFP